MDFLNLAKRRRSIRKFDSRDIPKELIDDILESGRWAPSGLNTQPWRFIVVDEPEKKKSVREIYDAARDRLRLYWQDTVFIEDATLVMLLADGSKPRPEWSCMLCAQNMLLCAEDLGLGSIIMTAPMDGQGKQQFTKLFGIKEPYQPLALLAFGHRLEEPEPKPRKPIEDTLSYNEF